MHKAILCQMPAKTTLILLIYSAAAKDSGSTATNAPGKIPYNTSPILETLMRQLWCVSALYSPVMTAASQDCRQVVTDFMPQCRY